MEIRHHLILNTALFAIVLTAALAMLMAFSSAAGLQGAPQAEWTRAYDGGHYDYGSAGLQTPDGGYVITGGVSASYKGDRDALLLKTDSNGSRQWQRSLGGDGFDYGYAVIEPLGGGYLIAGVTESRGNGSGDVYLARTDIDGKPLWERTFGGSGYDEGRALSPAPDGGYIIAGSTGSSGNGGSDIYVVKADAEGKLQWETTFGGPYDDLAMSVERTRSGNGFVIGGRYGTADGGNAYLFEIDDRGNLLWDTYPGGHDSIVYKTRKTPDRGYIAVGYDGVQSGNSSISLSRINNTGAVRWQRTIDATDQALKGYDVFLAPDGGYVIVGESGGGAGADEGLLVKTDQEGNVEWRQTYGAEHDVFIRSGIATKDGGLVLVGSAGDKGDVETWDVYLVKLGRI